MTRHIRLYCILWASLFGTLLADDIEEQRLERQREDQKIEDDRLERQREDQKIEDDRLERQREDDKRYQRKLDDERWERAHGH